MIGGRGFLSTVLLVDGLQVPFDEAGVLLSRNYFVEREIEKRGGESFSLGRRNALGTQPHWTCKYRVTRPVGWGGGVGFGAAALGAVRCRGCFMKSVAGVDPVGS